MRLTRPMEARDRRQSAAPIGQPLAGPTDPRWVLAVRTAEQLEGPLLQPERRQRLVRLGRLLGLTAFDANLVVAIVQDQARRGILPEQCPSAGESQLMLVPLAGRAKVQHIFQTPTARWALAILAALITVELIVVTWLFGG